MLHLLSIVGYLYCAMSRDAMRKWFLSFPPLSPCSMLSPPLLWLKALLWTYTGEVGQVLQTRPSLVMSMLQMYLNARTSYQSSCVLLSPEAAPGDRGHYSVGMLTPSRHE